jgi:hypothetical protein
LGQADTSPTEVLCKVLLTVAACRKENGLLLLMILFLGDVLRKGVYLDWKCCLSLIVYSSLSQADQRQLEV